MKRPAPGTALVCLAAAALVLATTACGPRYRRVKVFEHRNLEVSLRSELGKGSCFEVIVPRASGDGMTAAAPGAPEQRAISSIDGQVILCIDIEREILDGMQGLLARWGAAPVVATGREGAIAAMQRVHEELGQWPALLLVDYHLDDDDTGLEVIAALRERAGVDLPAAILTADHTDDVAAQVDSAGHTLLNKPVKPAALRALINRILSRRVAA